MDTNKLKELLTQKRGAQAKPSTGGGAFHEKLGTMARSRKGRSYRKGNGYVFYCPSDEEWNRANLGIH